MKTAILVLLAVCLSLIQCQGTFVRFQIDDFEVGTNNLLITIPQNAQFPVSDTDVYTDPGNPAGLLGGERDLLLAAESGPALRSLDSQVGNGEWIVSTPPGASGYANIQWDGKDGTIDLALNGLQNFDLTDGNLAEQFSATISTDVDTVYTFTITSPNGNQCTQDITIPGNPGQDFQYFIPFDSFGGNCDFTNVGAIDILIEQFENVDSIIQFFAIVGQPDPTTTTRTPTPTPAPSGSVPPSVAVCVCDCPTFRCGVVFKIPDDDDDTVDDDNHDDDDLVYRPVYYGPIDDDFDALTGDDDEDEFISWEHNLATTGIHDDDDLVYFESASTASSNVVSLYTVLVTLALVLYV